MPASPRHADQQASQFSGSQVVAYSQNTFAPVSLQVHPANPTVPSARRPSDSTTYPYSATTGPRELSYRQLPEFAYSPNTPQLSQTWVHVRSRRGVTDVYSMATTLLQQPQHSFSQLSSHYNESIYTSYSGMHHLPLLTI